MSEKAKSVAAWVAISITVLMSAWAFTLAKERGDAVVEQKALNLEKRVELLESDMKIQQVELSAIRILLTRMDAEQQNQQKLLEKIDKKID